MPKAREATIEKFQDKKSEWRWRLRAPNGRIMADSAEGYSSKAKVEQAISAVIAYINGGYETRLKIVTLHPKETQAQQDEVGDYKKRVGGQIWRLIRDQLAPDRDFDLSWRLIDDCGADSLDVVELVIAAEDTFNIEIPDEEAEKFFTGQDIVDYVYSRIEAQGGNL